MELVTIIASLINPENAVADTERYNVFDDRLAVSAASSPLWREEPEEIIATSSEIIAPTSTSVQEDSSLLRCSCISFVRKLSQFQPAPVAQAIDIPVKYQIPIPGAWVLFRAGPMYSKYGHVSYILNVSTSTITVIERNFKKCEITKREINKNDPNIRGYYY